MESKQQNRVPPPLPFMRLHERPQDRVHAAEVSAALFPEPLKHVGIEAQMHRRFVGCRHYHASVAPELLVHGMNRSVRTGAGFATCARSRLRSARSMGHRDVPLAKLTGATIGMSRKGLSTSRSASPVR